MAELDFICTLSDNLFCAQDYQGRWINLNQVMYFDVGVQMEKDIISIRCMMPGPFMTYLGEYETKEQAETILIRLLTGVPYA